MLNHASIAECFDALMDDETDDARRALAVVPTAELLDVERIGIRLIWLCRDLRHAREQATRNLLP